MDSKKITLLLVAVLAVCATFGIAQQAPTQLILSSYKDSDCSGTQLPFNVSIPLDSCLNNHDFTVPDCTVLHRCISQLSQRFMGTFPYEQLVNCSGAPSMHLSVDNTYDASINKLESKIYIISKTCFGIPLPLHFASGECASKFTLSPKCGIAGASLSWR